MNNFSKKIFLLFKTYKWLLLPIIPMFIFLWYLVYLFSTPSKPTTQIPNIPTTTTVPEKQVEITPGVQESENEIPDDFEFRSDFQKKETGEDGSIIYFFDSGNDQRPNIIIVSNKKDFIFSRTLNSEAVGIANISILKEIFGEPERIINGTKFYGNNSAIYIYSSQGLALIGNSQTDETFEEQRFPAMSVDAYLQRFSDQN